MRRIAVLNSYNVLPGIRGRETRRVQNFITALSRNGYEEGRDYELVMLDIEERPAMHAAVRELIDEGVDLIHAIGTPNAFAAASATSTVPIVYYGAHPEGIAHETLGAENCTGRIMALPFTANYKNFRFVRRFLPHIETVHAVFFADTVFVRPEMRELHDAARARAGRRIWLSGKDNAPVGFRTLAGLGYIVGVEYKELIFSDADELEKAIEEIDPATGMLMTYNELMHCPGGLETVVRKTSEMNLSMIFNNNAQVVARGLLAGIAADWALCGTQAGETAARILDGMRPHDIPRELHPNQVSWINLDTAKRLGVQLDDSLLSYFDRRVVGHVTDLCM